MDWKSYYDAELRETKARVSIARWLRNADEMTRLSGTYDSRTLLSFPHTALDYSGPLQARVISWLYGEGFKRVIALGVLHGSLVPAYLVAADPHADRAEREAAYAAVSGAFLPTTKHLDTPFGALQLGTLKPPYSAATRPDTANLLKNEFSLDTFHALVRLAADVYHVKPLTVIPLFIGMTRDPMTGSFDVAKTLASQLSNLWDEGTAMVMTGDVVHFGAVYGSEPTGISPLQLESQFHRRVETLLDLALREEKSEATFQMALQELKSDQREILPLLPHLLGERTSVSMDAFSLSDYAGIFDTAPPCLVASALIAYKRQRVE